MATSVKKKQKKIRRLKKLYQKLRDLRKQIELTNTSEFWNYTTG
ncbi:MAG: hypothetical protein ACE5GM_06565 [bacterium]